jgi:hypothetical protein
MTDILSEYHCVIGAEKGDKHFQQLLEYIQTAAVYTNCGFEYTPVKGHHIHICVIFCPKYDDKWKKALDRLRKDLDFVKKHKGKGRGWYWRAATTDNNLAYIQKHETKTSDNIRWVHPSVTDEILELIETYENKSEEIVGKHQKSKNKRYEEMKEYIKEELKGTAHPDKYAIGKCILSFYRNHLDSLLPTKSVFNSLLNTFLYDHHIVSHEELVNNLIDI